MPLKIISVAGARPNFVKIAPLYRAFQQYGSLVVHRICHTGQHSDEKMSKVFFDELEIPAPDFYLGARGSTHATQTAAIMVTFEKVLDAENPDLVIVPGDVNSTLAAALTAAKKGIKIAHVEAGLRSFDRTMPEEINRIVTDVLADLLFVTEQSGIDNLRREGIGEEKIFFTGNVMIDSLIYCLDRIKQLRVCRSFSLDPGDYVIVTFHRPSNVDTAGGLEKLTDLLAFLSGHHPVIFPMHPRTRENFKKFDLLKKIPSRVILTEPLGYVDFLSLVYHARMVVTDSGGIQEETTFLGIPCITVRNSTERPVTVTEGTNHLAGTDMQKVKEIVLQVLEGKSKEGKIPPLWDGKAAERIARIIMEKYA